MRLKLKFAGAPPAVVDAPDGASLDALAALAASTFSLADAASLSLWTGFPAARVTSGADVRGGALVEVRAPPPVTRHSVPADNSCLFTAVGWLLSLAADAPALRRACAAAVLADPAAFSSAVLGRAPADYAAHICRSATWGGGIELAVLARAHATELAAVEVRSGTLYVFGEGAGFSKRAYLVFDGMHYDGTL